MLQNLTKCTLYHLNVQIMELFKMPHFIHIIIGFFLQTKLALTCLSNGTWPHVIRAPPPHTI